MASKPTGKLRWMACTMQKVSHRISPMMGAQSIGCELVEAILCAGIIDTGVQCGRRGEGGQTACPHMGRRINDDRCMGIPHRGGRIHI